MTEILAEQLETEQSMFVQTAQGIESDGAKLTLQGITSSTLYFSDRPQRVVGQMATSDFVDLWAIGDNSFETDPPNAVLSFLEPGADVPVDAVVVLRAPSLASDGNLSYSIDVIEGTVPAHTGPVTLFIDPFGRPLSPVSVCGVRKARATTETSRDLNAKRRRPGPNDDLQDVGGAPRPITRRRTEKRRSDG